MNGAALRGFRRACARIKRGVVDDSVELAARSRENGVEKGIHRLGPGKVRLDGECVRPFGAQFLDKGMRFVGGGAIVDDYIRPRVRKNTGYGTSDALSCASDKDVAFVHELIIS